MKKKGDTDIDAKPKEGRETKEIEEFFKKFGKEELESFLWSVYVFSRYPEDEDYIYIIKSIHSGGEINWGFIRDDLGKGDELRDKKDGSKILLFLNRWRYHVGKGKCKHMHKIVENWIDEISNKKGTKNYNAEGFPNALYEELVEKEKARKGYKRFGPTATSKFLHILRPDIFAMWDNPIRCIFHNRSDGNHNGFYTAEKYKHYCKLLRSTIQCSIEEVGTKKIWNQLNKAIDYGIKKYPLKFIDEYLWTRFTGEYYRIANEIKREEKKESTKSIIQKVMGAKEKIGPEKPLLELISRIK